MSTKGPGYSHAIDEFRREEFYFFLLDVFLSLVNDELSLCFEMISHLFWHLSGMQCAKIEQFLEVMIAICGLELALNMSYM